MRTAAGFDHLQVTPADYDSVLAIETQAHAAGLEEVRAALMFAVVEAARRLSDKRTLDGDGFWVSKREMRYLDNALADFDESLPTADYVRGILGEARS